MSDTVARRPRYRPTALPKSLPYFSDDERRSTDADTFYRPLLAGRRRE